MIALHTSSETMADLRKLKNEALEAAAKGNWRKAVWCYANLEKDEPAEHGWALKLGESLRKMGNDGEAIKALGRAVNAYAKTGLILKAIAVCKIILGIDPRNSHTQELLDSFYAAQRKPTDPGVPMPKRTPSPLSAVQFPSVPAQAYTTAVPPAVLAAAPADPFAVSSTVKVPRPAAVATPVAPVAPVAVARPPAVSASPALPPLRQLRLAALMPGSRPSQQVPAAGSSGAMEIPIDDEFASEAAWSTHPHKGAGRTTMAHFVLPKTPFFSVLSRDLFRMAVERVRLIQLAAGETLFSRGDPGDALYVVAWGEIAVLAPQEIARLSEGDFFGEIALLADRPRTATVRATVDSQILAIDRELLNDLIAGSPELLKVLLRFLRERLIAMLAETSPLFAPFTPLERLGLAARFHFLEIDEGLRIVEEGGKSPGLFVLLAGEAKAVANDRIVAHLESGDVFGEISLIANQPASASVVALTKSFVLYLPRADFSEIIMTHPQVLEHISSLAEARMREIGRIDML
jgi:CRP-like cAMP-binding protein